MKVKLIGITKPASESAEMFLPKDIISYCARVSNPANQENYATADKLLSYCVNHNHWSPFEMVNLVLEIETTRDIARQILRHRSFTFQEFSQRYAAVTGFSEPRETRLQDPKNRQNSIAIDNKDLQQQWENKQDYIIQAARQVYQWAIDEGVAKEVARSVLPEGLTMSRMYMNGTLRSWIHYCLLRMDRMVDPHTGEYITGTQKEHREVATACWNIITNEFKFLQDIYGEKNASN